MPDMICPKCEAVEEDFDGFGMLHCRACGWCSHASISDDVCGLCEHVIVTIENDDGTVSHLTQAEAEEREEAEQT